MSKTGGKSPASGLLILNNIIAILKFADAEVDAQLQAALPPAQNDGAQSDDAAASNTSQEFDDWQLSDSEWAQVAAASP